ncbi:LysR family transcriptional regulator [Asaia krungthepensis]|nr:LysR family transcriptional regulator [Asaia krungthepensis]
MPVFSRFLTYFSAVARHGSIRRAAETLGISASSIDRQILLGEERLGVALFERLPTGLRMTAAGELLLAQSVQWHRDLESYRGHVDDLKGMKRGHVTLLIPEALARGFVPRILAGIRRSHPGITLSVKVLGNHEIGPALIEGRGDLAFMFDAVASSRLTLRGHMDFPLGIVTVPGHPLTRETHARFSDCASWPLIMPAAPLALAEKLDWLAAETGVRITPVCESDDIETLKSLVRHGVGISVMSYVDVIEEVESGALAFIGLAHPKLRPFSLSFCVDQARSLPVAVRLVAAALDKAISDKQGLAPPPDPEPAAREAPPGA